MVPGLTISYFTSKNKREKKETKPLSNAPGQSKACHRFPCKIAENWRGSGDQMKSIVLSRPKPGADKLKIHLQKSVGHVASQRKRI